MNIENETPRMRSGELGGEPDAPTYWVRSLREEVSLTPSERGLVSLIDGRRTFSEIVEAYSTRQGQLNFKDFFIQLNRLAAKAVIEYPTDFASLLMQYLKEGLSGPKEEYKGCYVTDPEKALRFEAEKLKGINGGLHYLEVIANKIPLFENLDPKGALAFFEHGRIRKFEKDEVIINKEDAGHDIYILLKGAAIAYNDDGILTEMYAGSVFGETPYVFDLRRTANVKASEPVLALELNRIALRELEKNLRELRTQHIFSVGEAQDSLGLVKKRFIINRIRMDQSSFKGIHQGLIEAFFGKAHVVNVQAKIKILSQNSLGKEFYILTAGHANVVKDGKVVARLYGGDYFGEISLFKAIPRTADVIAASDCSLLRIYKGDFLKLLCSNLRLALMIESNIDQRLAESPEVPSPARPLTGKMLI